ncbi:RHS repeat domain-containing protein [Lysinibacillus sp. NPDC093692]|uniref:RHS repeat domain-containing protein n=1 Tax=Lysinibacillus sp. NPDC093692 TaxID=3390578 RepID=UPI003D07D619
MKPTVFTWIFNDGFVPSAKITSEGNYSIISDYLGTPVVAYNEKGNKVWSAELDIYGEITEFKGEKDFIPFRYQGQYEDVEIGFITTDSGTTLQMRGCIYNKILLDLRVEIQLCMGM